jgi:Sec-independent protein translocase protein TatA
VGFGTEILFMLVLGLLVVGPRRLCAMLGHMARAKAELENATRGIKSQLAAQLDAAPMATETDSSQESVGTVNLVQHPNLRGSLGNQHNHHYCQRPSPKQGVSRAWTNSAMPEGLRLGQQRKNDRWKGGLALMGI